MAHVIDSKAETAPGELRELLDKVERQLPSLSAADVESFLERLDRIDNLLAILGGEGIDLRPEQTRWLDLQDRLRTKANQVVRAARAVGGMGALRARHPPAQRAWWHLDSYVAAARRRTLQRLALFLAGLLVVGLLAVWAYTTWLAPGPDTVLLVDTLNQVDTHVADADWSQALAAVEAALSTLPDDPDLLTWGTVLADRLGLSDKAADYEQRAIAALGNDREAYYVAVGMHRYTMDDLDRAQAAAESALAVNPQSAQATFVLANIAEARGDYVRAIDLFDRTASLAEVTNPQLAVVSKMRLGILLQQSQPPPATESQAAP